jgi:hypothetical protein
MTTYRQHGEYGKGNLLKGIERHFNLENAYWGSLWGIEVEEENLKKKDVRFKIFFERFKIEKSLRDSWYKISNIPKVFNTS